MIENFLIVAQQVAVLFVLMGCGAVMRVAGILKAGEVDGLINVLILVVTPCLIIDVFQRPFDPAMLRGLGFAGLIAALVHVALILLSKCAIRHRDEDLRAPLRLAAVFSNAGFMGIPLEQAVLGDAGVFYGIIYVGVFNLFIWSWGIRLMEKDGPKGRRRGGSLRMWVNPGTLGIALGLALFFASAKLPAVIGSAVHHMANLNTPLAMIAIGYALMGAQFGKVLRTGAVYVTAFVRLVACPLLLVAALYPFRHALDRNMMLALTVAASAPVAAMVSMFAAKYGRDVDASVAVVSGTTLLSIVTMPVVVAFAMAVL